MIKSIFRLTKNTARRLIYGFVALTVLSGCSIIAVATENTEVNLLSGISASAEVSAPINLLSGLTAESFSPATSQVGSSYSATSMGTLLTDGKSDTATGEHKWYVSWAPSAGSHVQYSLTAATELNTVVIYAGMLNGSNTQDLIKADEVTISYDTGDGTWKNVTNVSADDKRQNTTPPQVLTFRFDTVAASKIQIFIQNTAAFRMMEIEAYNKVGEDSSDGEIDDDTPTPTPPTPDYGGFDYDTSKNILFDLTEENIVISSGDCNNKQSLCDGYAESATGYGDTKWFVQTPSEEEYVEFNLPNEKTVNKLVVCSGPTMQSDPDIVTDCQLFYWKDGSYIPVDGSQISSNTDQVCEVSFAPVISTKFKLLVKNTIRFRIREIRMEGPRIDCNDLLPANNTYVDCGNVEIKFSLQDDSNSVSKVTLQLDETEQIISKTNDLYIYTSEIAIPAKHDCVVRAYNSENQLLFRQKLTFFTLNISQGVSAFNNSKGNATQMNALNQLIPNFEVLGLDTELLQNIGSGTGTKLVQKFSEKPNYAESKDGIEKLYQDLCEVLPMATVNGASSDAEMLSAINIFGNDLNLYMADYNDFLPADQLSVCANLVTLKNQSGDFENAERFGEKFLENCALLAYSKTYAPLLPDLFEHYKSVCNISLAGISSDILNDVLFELKKATISNYSDIPAALIVAHNTVKASKNPPQIFGGGGGGGGGGGPVFTVKDEKETEDKIETSNKPIFSDLNGYEWAEEAILELNSKGIVQGDGNGKFRCDDNVSRAEFVKMLIYALGIPAEKSESKFEDIKKEDWFYNSVATAYNLGIINGKNEQEFMPGHAITREEMATVIYRALLFCNYEFTTEGSELIYEDKGDISDFAKTAITMLSANSLVQGDGDLFYPKENLTRAEAAVAISRLIQ